jgi:CBS domain-containing protein
MNRLRAVDVMTSPVVTVGLGAPITEVVRLLRRRGISGVPVVDKLHRLAGIITEGDILLKEAGAGGYPMLAYMGRPFARTQASRELHRTHGRTAEDVMVRDVVTAVQAAPLREIAGLMARHGINRIPIVRNHHVVGIVTRADVLKAFDRPDATLRAEVRSVLLTDLAIDPDRFEIDVSEGVVRLRGTVEDPRDIGLIETFLSEIDGLTAVDVSGLSRKEKASA